MFKGSRDLIRLTFRAWLPLSCAAAPANMASGLFTGRDAVTGKPTLAAFGAKGRYMDNLTVEDDRFERNNQ